MSSERLKEVVFSSDTNRGPIEQDEHDMKEWTDYFFNKSSKILNPSDSRLEVANQKNEPVQFYNLIIESIDGITKRLQVIFK
jgi:hypothetical protein